MSHSFWGYFIIMSGIVGISIMLLFQDIVNTDEQNYYLIKEITQNSMLDAVDKTYYATTNGKVAINKEKFVENFLRRLSGNSSFNKTYNVKIYDIVEEPPKVSLSVGSKSNVFSFTGEDFDIINKLDAIIETRYSVE